jgi:CYTH domain-containing protein
MAEIERKWVLEAPPDGLAERAHERVEQGYVALDAAGAEVRVRRRGAKHTLTVKSAPGLVRVEEELPLSEDQFASLWELTEGRRIVKTRHLVPLDDDLTAEVDVYEGALAGLVTAEVEFPSEEASAAFDPPAWLGREVTGDGRYANRALAVNGPVRSDAPGSR